MSITALIPDSNSRIGGTGVTPPAADPEDPAVVLAAYARQVDELARLVEDWQAAAAGYARVLAHALGELHVALDEAATTLDRRKGRP
jgi:hypothetical protein